MEESLGKLLLKQAEGGTQEPSCTSRSWDSGADPTEKQGGSSLSWPFVFKTRNGTTHIYRNFFYDILLWPMK